MRAEATGSPATVRTEPETAASAAMALGDRRNKRNTAAQAESLRHLDCELIGIAGGFDQEVQTQI
jgi:hypothetical protein